MSVLILAVVVVAIAVALAWALVHEVRRELDPPPIVVTLSVDTAKFLEGISRAAAAAALREMAEKLRQGAGG